MWATSWRDLRPDVGALSGGKCDVRFGCVSGDKLTDSPRQAQESAPYGPNLYDWVSAVGRWDSPGLLVFATSSMEKEPPPQITR